MASPWFSVRSILVPTKPCHTCGSRGKTIRRWAGAPFAWRWTGRHLLRLQVRALLIAGQGRDLKIMFPMIADVDEYLRAREIVEMEKAYLLARGHVLPKSLQLGVMIEIPALIWQLDQLFPLIDFASVGSNDLVQFLFASDRGNPKLAGRYDPLSPAALGAMRLIVEKANRPQETCDFMR